MSRFCGRPVHQIPFGSLSPKFSFFLGGWPSKSQLLRKQLPEKEVSRLTDSDLDDGAVQAEQNFWHTLWGRVGQASGCATDFCMLCLGTDKWGCIKTPY